MKRKIFMFSFWFVVDVFFFLVFMWDCDELVVVLEVRDRIKYDLSIFEREEILFIGDLIVEVMFCKIDFEDNNGLFLN